MVTSNPSIAGALQQFACPHEGWDGRVSQAIKSTVARVIIDNFVERNQSCLSDSSNGLVELLRTLAAQDADVEPRWESCVGTMERAPSNSDEVLPAAVGLALCCTGRPDLVHWEVSLSRVNSPRWGRWVLPPTGEMSVRYEGLRAVVTYKTSGGRTSTLTLDSANETATNCEELPQIGTKRAIVLLPRSAAPDGVWRDFEELGRLSVPTIDPVMIQSLSSGIGLIAEYAPHYRDWVERAISEIVVSQCREGSQSGSWREAPGTVQLSWSPDPITVAESLVHEATHQYAYQVYRISALDDGTDAALYYSPAAGRNRPLERILFAYHAFANVLLFYLESLKAGLPVGASLETRISRSRTLVEELDPPLRNNSALTPAGRAIYEPLHEQLAIHGH